MFDILFYLTRNRTVQRFSNNRLNNKYYIKKFTYLMIYFGKHKKIKVKPNQ